MRQTTASGVTLKYPDELGFAFNPCLLVVTGAGVTGMRIEMTGENGVTISDTRDAFDGGCYIEVREYIQSFFDDDTFSNLNYDAQVERTKMGQQVIFKLVALKGETEVVFDFDVFYIWGAMKAAANEVYNGPRVLHVWKGYPFTFGVFCSASDELTVTKGVVPTTVDVPRLGVWNVKLVADGSVETYKVTSANGGMKQATFDNTFDLTFQQLPFDAGTYITIKLGCEVENGVYLRWIDRHGFYNYWLFVKGAEQRKIENDGQFLRNNIVSVDMTYGYNGGLGRQMMMKRQDVVPVCAPLVDSDTYDMLCDMASSPYVDMLVGYSLGKPKWVSVQPQAATYTKSKAVLQDFVANILMPEMMIQKL